MPFNRTKTFDYAHIHWQIPCDDGLVAVSGSTKGLSVEFEFQRLLPGENRKAWEAVFDWTFDSSGKINGENGYFIPHNASDPREVVFVEWSRLNDCAHFVKKCLGAGGIRLGDIGSVPQLNKKLRSLGNTKVLADNISSSRAKRVIEKTPIMKKGDIIMYVKASSGGYFHSSVYLGDGKISCHTASRWKSDWNLYKEQNYTLIHFSDDDKAPSSQQTDWLPGWWELTFKGTKYYYYYWANGQVKYTKTKPRSLKTRIAASDGRGHWFRKNAKEYMIIWQSTGSVEEMKLESRSRQKGTWNEHTNFVAERMTA